ncbi:NAD(P)-binding protein [Mycena amicta]|nr:NAD(P)-binding protein [Mycena amicta]
MPSLSSARNFNAAHVPTSYTPTAIFVGGTSGIGQGMAEAFARHTKGNASIIIVGRNRAAAESIIASFPKPTADGVKHEFVECDMTLMKTVGRVAAELRARIPKINFLVLSPGVMTLDGRNETEEGIDRKLAVHYYGRHRFIKEVLPSLEAAHAAGEDAKVMSVLAAGHGGSINVDDLGLKKTFSLPNAAKAATTYNDIMVKDFAARYPGLSFIHSYPGTVNTGLFKTSNSAVIRYSQLLVPLLSPFLYSVESSGEHQLHGLLKADAGASRTNDKGDDISWKTSYYGTPDAMARLWKHTEEETMR